MYWLNKMGDCRLCGEDGHVLEFNISFVPCSNLDQNGVGFVTLVALFVWCLIIPSGIGRFSCG